MTSPTTRLHTGDDGLVGECTACGVQLSQLPGFDRDVAVGTFLLCHPSSPVAVHRPDLPAGWAEAPFVAA